jgi:8-oxo-dGTP pyrophosphatase MutT (NUDIX family)
MNKIETFWISQAALIINDNKLLIVELANNPGYWDIPGGRIDVGEGDKSVDAFRREILEEIGVKKFDIIDIVDYDIWYVKKEKHTQGVCALLFLIDNLDTYDINLSSEHINYKWVAEAELGNDKYFWPGATRMIKNGFKKYNQFKNN